MVASGVGDDVVYDIIVCGSRVADIVDVHSIV